MEMQYWKKIDYYRNNLHLCRNGKKLNEMIPRGWCKFGEIYVSTQSQIFFLCSICVEYAEHFRQAFSTSNPNDLQEHLRKLHGINYISSSSRGSSCTSRSSSLQVLDQFLPNSKAIIGPAPVSEQENEPIRSNTPNDTSEVMEISSSLEEVSSTSKQPLHKDRNDKKSKIRKFKSTKCQSTKNNNVTNNLKNIGLETLLMSSEGSASNLSDESSENTNRIYKIDNQMLNHAKNRKVSDRPYKCNICGKRTLSDEALNVHKSRFHSTISHSSTIVCEICQKVVLKSNIHQHKLVHTDLRFYCPFCNNSYKQKQTLTLHIKRLHEIPTDKLDISPKSPNANGCNTDTHNY